MATPAERRLWWHLYPLGFLGAEAASLPDGHAAIPRLRRLEPWLDYMRELGCDGLLLGPIFESLTHGYDTVDHDLVDRRLGTYDDLVWLIDAARARGIAVVLDGVFNHVGRGFSRFADVVAHGAASPHADWFVLNWDAPGPDGFDYEHFEGHRALVTLNHDLPAVADYVVDVVCRGLRLGIAGWRLDAAYAVPTQFWHTVTERVRARHPEAWLIGEVIHGDYARFVNESGLASVTQYELWKAMWSSLNDKNFFELAWALERHNALLERFAPVTFVGNHDVTRIASLLNDVEVLSHALVILLTVGGTPSIYAGDEQAFRGIKEARAGGDDAIRPAFPATPVGLAPWGASTFAVHRELLAIRRANPWLTRARTRILELTNDTLWFESANGKDAVIVGLNLREQSCSAPTGACLGPRLAGSGDPSELPAKAWAIFQRDDR